jgi:hypothetical protein
MRNIPGYPTDTDVLKPIARVVHGGKDREIHGLSLTRDLSSSLHAQVARLGGITQAEGSAEWAAEQDVVESYPTAFNRQGNWPPRLRDSIGAWFGYEAANGDPLVAKALTGVIKNNSGDPKEGHGSGLVDGIARLSNRITLPPLQSIMPPLVAGGPWRGVTLYPTFFTDIAARAGRFFSTPGMGGSCIFSAPLMGSTWPERGTLVTGLRNTDRGNAVARWHRTPWGMGVSDAYLSYTPAGTSSLNRPMEITAMSPAGPFAGRSYVAARWGTSEIRLNFNNNAVYGMVNGAVVVELGYVAGNVFTLQVVPAGGNMTLSLRDEAGREVSASTAIASGSGNAMDEVRVVSEVEGAIIGGAQVSFPGTAWQAVNYTRSAFIGPPAHSASLTASPPIMDVTARSFLEDQSRAELAAMWIDEDGFLQWRNRNALVNGASAATLTTLDHLHALPWEEDFAGVSSKVEVTGRTATVQRSKHPVFPLWESGQSGADPGNEFEWLIHPEADMDWIMPDQNFGSLHNTNLDGFRRFNRGVGSWVALRAERTDGMISTWGGAFAACTFIDHQTYKISCSVFGFSSGNGLYEFSLKVPAPEPDSLDSIGPSRYQPGLSTPTLRGPATTMWENVKYRANSGVWDAPVLTHDVGWFVQAPVAVQAIADDLAAATTLPRPFLSGIDMVPDPRLQRGDIITLTDKKGTGLQFRCLLVGITDTFSEGAQWSQSCSFRVLDYTRISATLEELDTAWAGNLLSALDAARVGETLAQLDAEPLKGAPA